MFQELLDPQIHFDNQNECYAQIWCLEMDLAKKNQSFRNWPCVLMWKTKKTCFSSPLAFFFLLKIPQKKCFSYGEKQVVTNPSCTRANVLDVININGQVRQNHRRPPLLTHLFNMPFKEICCSRLWQQANYSCPVLGQRRCTLRWPRAQMRIVEQWLEGLRLVES